MRLTLFFFASITAAVGVAQPPDDVMLKAMTDELQRNMNELELPGHQKPFFIQYTIADYQVCQVAGTLGALLQSNTTRSRTKASVRILVGDYAFNDESLDNNLYSEPGNNEIGLPLDNDYQGIRRALWVTTDNVYKSAARQFKKNQETLRDLGRELKDVPHRSFAPLPPHRLIENHTARPFEVARWEDYVRQVSAVARDYPQIMNSNAILFFSEGYDYTVNSEGTQIRIPKTLAWLQANVQLRSASGLFLYDTYAVYAAEPAKLPPAREAAAAFRHLIDKLLQSDNLPALDEEYTGPVLAEGQVVAEVFHEALFGGRESLILSNDIQNASGFRMEAANMESRIGKPIMDAGVSISARSRLKKYNGTDLLGAFDADSEGVIPPDELVLVEKGVLKELLNDRTITKPAQKPNGHAGGPGVIEIKIENPPGDALKQKLLARAREEGLEFALILRATAGAPFEVVRVYVADGREEPVRADQLGGVSLRNLRRIPGSSANTAVFHVGGDGNANSLASYIVPQAVLFQELTVMPPGSATFDEEVLVENPLKKAR
jgi:predicted Zn-dependent protease